MKHFKIIETGSEIPDVLLYRDRDDQEVELVNILAIGEQGDSKDYFAYETVKFQDASGAIDFINDFSVKSAEAFCKRNDVVYI